MTRTTRPVALALVAAALLAGCQAAPTTSRLPLQAAPKAAARVAAPSVRVVAAPATQPDAPAPDPIAADLTALLVQERDADDLDMLADEAPRSYAVMAAGAPGADSPLARLKQRLGALREDLAAKLGARRKARRELAKPRLEKLRAVRADLKEAAAKAPWTDHGDGTRTQVITVPVPAPQQGTRTVTRTLRGTTLVELVATLDQAGPLGATAKLQRTKTLQADGSYLVVMHGEATGPKDGERLVDLTKTISADGAVTGTGTLTVKRGGVVVKTIQLHVGGAEGAEVVKAHDGGATTTVTLPADGAPEAELAAADGATPATI
ncbi:MAG: hypothetical protein VKS61_14325 [Candidatus Sericytochromatia bacterium]|nr:hypothetical protein [Candidatus Sericytochromatia bacterium]